MADLRDDAMSRFPVPDESDVPDDLRERMDEETERAGFTPNVFSAYAYKPSHWRGFFEYYDAIVEDATIERHEIEQIIVVVSAANDCLYCVVAHGALCRIYNEDPKLADQLATNYRSADLRKRQRRILDFAVKLTEEPARIGDADVQALKDVGLMEKEIWDVASVVAFFNLSNRMAAVADMRPNDEFYTLGRDIELDEE